MKRKSATGLMYFGPGGRGPTAGFLSAAVGSTVGKPANADKLGAALRDVADNELKPWSAPAE
jgi:hypothetical protein